MELQKPVSIVDVWQRSMLFTKVLFVLVVFYTALSVYILLWGLGITDNILSPNENYTWIIYSIVSFGLATLLAAYHLATLIFRQKRAADLLAQQQRASS